MSIPVTVSCPDEEHATKIATLLRVLGYEVALDELPSTEDHLELAAERVGAQYSLTPRETEVVLAVLLGWSPLRFLRLRRMTRGTLKWHMHNVFKKTGTSNREELVRLALGLPRCEEDEGQVETDDAAVMNVVPLR